MLYKILLSRALFPAFVLSRFSLAHSLKSSTIGNPISIFINEIVIFISFTALIQITTKSIREVIMHAIIIIISESANFLVQATQVDDYSRAGTNAIQTLNASGYTTTAGTAMTATMEQLNTAFNDITTSISSLANTLTSVANGYDAMNAELVRAFTF